MFQRNLTMRSDIMKSGLERAPHRSLMHATGIKAEEIQRPFIGVCNSYTNIAPGHCHLNKVGQIICDEIRAAGGVPYEFNTIAVCDGIAIGHQGMKYSLPSREIIADSVESMGMAHPFDAMICIPNCDKVVPGMLMGAMRLNIPTIFASGGPMLPGKKFDFTKSETDLISVFEGVAGKKTGNISEEQLAELESLDPREGKRDTAATARDESARACPTSRRGLTPLGRLQKYPKIHVSTGEECSGSGPDSKQDLRPRHRRERNPERPPSNSHGDWPFLRPPERVAEVPVLSREHLPQLEKIQEVLPSRRDEAHFQ